MKSFSQMLIRSYRWYVNDEAVRWKYATDRRFDYTDLVATIRTPSDLAGVTMLAEHMQVADEVRQYAQTSR